MFYTQNTFSRTDLLYRYDLPSPFPMFLWIFGIIFLAILVVLSIFAAMPGIWRIFILPLYLGIGVGLILSDRNKLSKILEGKIRDPRLIHGVLRRRPYTIFFPLIGWFYFDSTQKNVAALNEIKNSLVLNDVLSEANVVAMENPLIALESIKNICGVELTLRHFASIRDTLVLILSREEDRLVKKATAATKEWLNVQFQYQCIRNKLDFGLTSEETEVLQIPSETTITEKTTRLMRERRKYWMQLSDFREMFLGHESWTLDKLRIFTQEYFENNM